MAEALPPVPRAPYEDGLLVVMDGAKALAAAVYEVFGTKAAVQRCTLHKRRNVADHLPDKQKAWVDAKLVTCRCPLWLMPRAPGRCRPLSLVVRLVWVRRT